MLADEIRKYIHENYIMPARNRGETKLVLLAREIRDRMGLISRMPEICMVLRGKKLRVLSNLELVEEIRLRSVKKDSSTNKFVFRIK